MVIIENIEFFEKKLKNILNNKCVDFFDLNLWRKELENQFFNNGVNYFEIPKQYTKSNTPKNIDFSVKYKNNNIYIIF